MGHSDMFVVRSGLNLVCVAFSLVVVRLISSKSYHSSHANVRLNQFKFQLESSCLFLVSDRVVWFVTVLL